MTVDRNCRIGFIQGGVIRVKGNLEVVKNIFHGNVICGKSLTVTGKGVKGNDLGAVLGGTVSAMISLDLHSAGSPAVKTHILCGINPELEKTLEQVRETQSVLERKLLGLRQKVKIDLTSPNAMKELQNLSDHKKEVVKKILVDMKAVSLQIKAIKGQIPILEKEAYCESTDQQITIKNHIVPEIHLRIRTGELVLNNQDKGATYSWDLVEGSIVRKTGKEKEQPQKDEPVPPEET